MTQRAIALVFLALQAALTAVLAVFLIAQGSRDATGAMLGAAAFSAAFIAYQRGWEPARQAVVVVSTLLLAFYTSEPYLTERTLPAVFIPPVVALMLTSSRWIIGSAVAEFCVLGIRSDFRFQLGTPLELAVFVMSISGLVLARRSMDAAMARLAAQVERAEAARQQSETAAHEAIAARDRASKLEAQLLHVQRLESVGRLAGGVAHDFNNLLTVIGASASMAERALATGGSATDDLHEIHLAVGRASELTKQLLAFARKQVLVKRHVELNDLVSNVERMLRRLIGQGVTLESRLSPLPLVVQADPGQIEQVILNLVINARDAITSGGKISLETTRLVMKNDWEPGIDGLSVGEYACISVQDTGIGMSEEVQSRLFEPFFTTKAPGRGTGLGLATSFGIVRQHEGVIRVTTEPSKGTRMRVILPLVIGVDSAPAISAVLPVSSGGRSRVLVVEDEPQVRAIAARALSGAGHEVLQAVNGAAALALIVAQSRPFDVLVTDVVMPELSGPELARAARARQPDLGLVFMSGYPEAMQSSGASEFLHAEFLAKPFAAPKLVAAVRQQLELRAQAEPQQAGEQKQA